MAHGVLFILFYWSWKGELAFVVVTSIVHSLLYIDTTTRVALEDLVSPPPEMGISD